LLHPRILEAAVRHAETAGGPYQVIVAPLLVEFGLTGWVDRVLVVDCPAETQLQRLLARDGGDEALARAILATQASREQRLAAADDVIVNDGPPERLPRPSRRSMPCTARWPPAARATAPGCASPSRTRGLRCFAASYRIAR
jgi:dephospho-CoA kinase